MEHTFDKPYWDDHWRKTSDGATGRREVPPNPHLLHEVGGLVPGRALEAGCGEGAEAVWLAQAGWQVTAVDIADEVLTSAAARGTALGLGDRIRWVQADLSSWEPPETFDLVTTHYAHAAIPQLALYDRLSGWVSPGGSLLVVGHLHGDHGADHGHGAHEGHGAHDDQQPPAEATVTAASITERLDPTAWTVVTADEHTRTVEAPDGSQSTWYDVVVRAVRR